CPPTPQSRPSDPHRRTPPPSLSGHEGARRARQGPPPKTVSRQACGYVRPSGLDGREAVFALPEHPSSEIKNHQASLFGCNVGTRINKTATKTAYVICRSSRFSQTAFEGKFRPSFSITYSKKPTNGWRMSFAKTSCVSKPLLLSSDHMSGPALRVHAARHH